MGSSQGPGIPEAEFASRVAEVRKFVVSRGLEALVVFSASRSNIWYQTGHVGYISNWSNSDRVFDTMVVLPAEGAPVLLIAGLPYVIEKVREVSWMTDVRAVGAEDPRAAALPGLTRTFGTEVRDILRERGREGKKVGLVGVEAMSVAVYQSLVRALSESAIEFCDDVVADLRCRKSPAEVALMREAARLSDLGFEALLEAASPGMRGYEVVAEAERAVRVQGADYARFWMASGPSESPVLCLPDLKPHRRKLEKGDQITCCSYVVHEGYWGHAMRTGTLGGASRRQDRILPPCLEVHRACIEAMKPGVPISDVVRLCRSKVEGAGMQLHSARIGHGIGLDYGEKPFLNEGNAECLEAGMTVELHTQVSIPGMGGFYVPLGDVCYIGEDGVEVLTKFPQEPFRA